MGFLFGSSGLLSGIGSALGSIGTNLIQPITGLFGSALSPLTGGTGKDGKGKSALDFLMGLDDSSFAEIMKQIQGQRKNTSADVASGSIVSPGASSASPSPQPQVVPAKNTAGQFAINAGGRPNYQFQTPAYPWQQYNEQTWRPRNYTM